MKSGVAAAVFACLVAPPPGSHRQTRLVLRDDERFHDRKAWVLENGSIRLTLLRDGGHIAELRLITADPLRGINPMYTPSGQGYAGHLVCFPYYGPASPEERKAGLSGHGEAGYVEWRQTRPPVVSGDRLTLSYGAELPKTQYRIERVVSMRLGAPLVTVEESVENLTAYDRPYNWNQHATFGAPFVGPRNALDMSGGRGMADPERTGNGQWAPGQEFRWPAVARSRRAISLREFRAVPEGQVYAAVVTDSGELGWFTLYNPDHRLMVGYTFPAADNPWIIDWQNQPQPGSDAGVARGIQFGTSPFDEGLRRSVERGQLLGVPAYRWIAAKGRRSTTFTIFLTEIPDGFAGVEGLGLEGTRLILRERGTGTKLTVARSPD